MCHGERRIRGETDLIDTLGHPGVLNWQLKGQLCPVFTCLVWPVPWLFLIFIFTQIICLNGKKEMFQTGRFHIKILNFLPLLEKIRRRGNTEPVFPLVCLKPSIGCACNIWHEFSGSPGPTPPYCPTPRLPHSQATHLAPEHWSSQPLFSYVRGDGAEGEGMRKGMDLRREERDRKKGKIALKPKQKKP